MAFYPREVLKFFGEKLKKKLRSASFFDAKLQFLQIFLQILLCKMQNKAYLYE